MLSTLSMLRRHLLLLCALLLFGFSVSLLWPALRQGQAVSPSSFRQREQATPQAWGYGGVSGLSAPSPTPTVIPTVAPSSTNSGDSSGGGILGISAGTVSTFMIQGFILPIEKQLQSFIADELQNSQLGLVWTTDPGITYNNPTISQLWDSLFLISLILLGVVLAWNFLRIMMKAFTLDYANALESIPKVIFAVIMSALSLRFVGLLIDLNNHLCAFIGHNFFMIALDTSNVGWLYLVIWFFYALMWLLLIVEAAIRLALLGVCIVVAPRAHAGLPVSSCSDLP